MQLGRMFRLDKAESKSAIQNSRSVNPDVALRFSQVQEVCYKIFGNRPFGNGLASDWQFECVTARIEMPVDQIRFMIVTSEC